MNVIQTQELYLQILDQFPNPIWRAALDTKCDFFNKAWLAFTGRTMEQEMGNGWTEGVHPDELKPCVEGYLAAFSSRKPFLLEYRLKHNDGTYHWLLDYGSPFFAQDGSFLGYIGSCYDNNETKLHTQLMERLNTQLMEREERIAELKKRIVQLEAPHVS